MFQAGRASATPVCSEEVFVFSVTPQTLFEFHHFSHCHLSSAALLTLAWTMGHAQAGMHGKAEAVKMKLTWKLTLEMAGCRLRPTK